MFNAEKIKELTNLTDVLVLEEIDSTNTFLKNCAFNKEQGALVIAKRQTKGRGRLLRTFFSEKNGLYMSFLLKPKNTDISQVTPIAAVAVFRAIKKYTEYTPEIKWVNDIFVNNLKVSGILTEAVSSGKDIKYLVVGIGVNLVKPQNDFNEEIKNIAGYLFKEKISFANEFVSEIINQFFDLYFNGGFLEDYRNNSLLTGKYVKYLKDGVERSGFVEGIDENCNLIVNNNGQKELLFTGEVTITKFK